LPAAGFQPAGPSTITADSALVAAVVQIFGIKGSAATRAAERFFKERRVQIQLVDLNQKPMAPAEIRRFTDRFGLANLLDTGSKAWEDAGLKYLRLTDAELLDKVARDPKLLKLPLVRSANKVAIGQDEEGWKSMLAAGPAVSARFSQPR
jgi:arsenate reductase (glutaredoxin)